MGQVLETDMEGSHVQVQFSWTVSQDQNVILEALLAVNNCWVNQVKLTIYQHESFNHIKAMSVKLVISESKKKTRGCAEKIVPEFCKVKEE